MHARVVTVYTIILNGIFDDVFFRLNTRLVYTIILAEACMVSLVIFFKTKLAPSVQNYKPLHDIFDIFSSITLTC